MASALEQALTAFDGRHNDVLKEIAVEFEATPATMRQAVRLLRHEHQHLAWGASFVLWTWLQGGVRATPALVRDLLQSLPELHDKWVQLHVVRSLPLMTLPESELGIVASFCERCFEQPFPFLRAWAMDALHHVALEFDALEARARRLREAAQDDPAPSVRARLRRLQG